MSKEIWKVIEDYPNYEVSNLGRVKNSNTNYILKPNTDSSTGYAKVRLLKNNAWFTKTIHRLVAEAFLGRYDNMEINHIDGDKENNELSNLEWCTRSQNLKHAYDNGLRTPTKGAGRKVRIVETGEIFDSLSECAQVINGQENTISMCLNDKYGRSSHKGFHFEQVIEKQPFLRDYQQDAVQRMKNGCILNGGVGSGKSRTGLYYYFSLHGGSKIPEYVPMTNPRDLYIITTAKKRDSKEWEAEMTPFLLYPDEDQNSYYGNRVVIDSWNNIQKYKDVHSAFFIFDEDRVTGSGAWVKAFLNIARKNKWVILSATPGDTWTDYIPVFVANGFYKNKTEFVREHIVYSRFSKYPKVDRYINTGRLLRLRDSILINMDFERDTIPHHEDVYVRYDIAKYKELIRNRWNIFENKPIKNANELCYLLRKIVNMDESRQIALLELIEKHPKVIIFYNFDYELEMLKSLYYGEKVKIAEWNGHKHEPIPDSKRWIYLVQYTAGCEGWNCIKTDTTIFYSQNYSYKVMEQASGRINRMNTPYKDLYYYHFKSRSGIDLAISKALSAKKRFNERKFTNWE